MDAKMSYNQPQRPARTLRGRVDENMIAFNRAGKTIHHRNKSSPALSALANNHSINNKEPARRAAFGDVSNTVNSLRSAKDDSSLPSKDSIKITEKPICLTRPAQRPIHSISTKSAVNTVINVDAGIKPGAEKPQAKKVQTKRANAVFKDPILQPVVEEPSSKQQQSQQQNQQQEKTSNAQASVSEASSKPAEASKEVEKTVKDATNAPKSVTTESAPAPVTKLVPAATAIAEEPATKEAVVKATVQPGPTGPNHSGKDASEMAKPKATRVSSDSVRGPRPLTKRPSDITASSRKYDHTLAQSEPEEYWEEDEEDNYDEDGYATARSYRSRDNTTGGATMVLFPKMSLQSRRELALAKQIMESTTSVEEYDEEWRDTTMVAEYGEEIFQYLRELEIKLLPNAHYMDNQAEIQWSMRSVLMDWLVQVHHRFSLLPETLFLCVNYIDRFLSCKIVSLGKLQLVGATAIFIAAKYEEINCPSVQEIVYMVDNGYTVDEILKAERFMLSMLQFELGWPGPMSFLRRISKADDYDLETRTLAKYFLELTIMDERFVGTPPSFTAAGAHCLARLMLRKGDWTPAHVFYSGYTFGQLYQLIGLILECCEAPQQHHLAIYEKYADRRFKRASIFVENEMLNGYRLPDVHEGSSLWSMLERRASSKRL
ncbi:G2/mitotic-specific cyclin-3 [Nannizzia gypsea CBS 118893]|uniref:G2/mitotic-specific cyclin-3 n=1 Tax=Arthroderma gypseum (strain ATCC MYA-4604 / CBS 118893) TaxID=535722 RepID=E4V480_ARTGP|nr:G2/mitotic-specific cyclin-3 [Nannizzia gypsea CBS 118893]EFR04804.1 G2/mitotic-specific cyclin-3 [Nannizzia gypsea CBS 118893]